MTVTRNSLNFLQNTSEIDTFVLSISQIPIAIVSSLKVCQKIETSRQVKYDSLILHSGVGVASDVSEIRPRALQRHHDAG